MDYDPRKLPAIEWAWIAGIRDHGGGHRVVWTDDVFSIPANTMFFKGEKYHVAPGVWPKNNAWEWYPWVEWWGTKAILDAERPPCGSCRACCITLFVADEGDGFTKPSHTPCNHLCNEGCGINKQKPATCKRFDCVWVKSQSGNDPMAPELRPDRCGSILTDHDQGAIRIHTGQHVTESSAALKKWVEERERLGWTFEDVSYYYGEQG